jgi:hypothetical protein
LHAAQNRPHRGVSFHRTLSAGGRAAAAGASPQQRRPRPGLPDPCLTLQLRGRLPQRCAKGAALLHCDKLARRGPMLGFAVFAADPSGFKNAFGYEASVFANFFLDPLCDLGIVLEKILGVFPALPEALAVIGKPCP